MKANTEMKLAKRLADKKFLILFAVIMLLIITLGCNVFLNTFNLIPKIIKDEATINITKLIFIFNKDYTIVYLIIYSIVLVMYIKFIFNIRASYGNMIEGQKGSNRFTTEKELVKQYKSIPEKETEDERNNGGYEGKGGVIISRIGENIFLDDSPTNNLIIGTTRSGKGEMFILPTIDIYSRAKEKASLVVNDPKGELYLNTKKSLEDRGYEVYALNLVNQLNSMSYNPLELILEAYINKNYSEAQLLCKTLTTMLYYNPEAKNRFWGDCASSLVDAIILAIIEEAFKGVLEFEKTIKYSDKNDELEKELQEKIEEAKNKVNMYAVAQMLSELGGDTNKVTKENALDKYFSNLPNSSLAKLPYATSKFAEGETRSGIFTTAMDKLGTFVYEETAKLTSRNSLDFKSIGFNKKARIKSKIKITKNLIEDDREEFLNKYGEVKLLNVKKCFYTDINTKLSDEELLTGVTAFSCNDKDISPNVKVDTSLVDWEKEGEYNVYFSVEDIENSKPKAVFLITPDYDRSNHVLASMYVRQLYYVLAKNASSSKSGKCDREVIFLLDEAGNMPPIDDMENTITVCLGRGIRFNIVIQAYSQLKKLYGEAYKTIVGNCGNQIYILTNDNETAEEFSKLLGEKTIIVNSRSGEILDTTKHQTETLESRRLLTPDELLNFKEGDMAISRVIKRRDLENKKIVAYPIYNTGKTNMKYRYEYLLDTFYVREGLEDIEIPTLHKDVDLNSIRDFINIDIRKSTSRNENIREEKNAPKNEKLEVKNSLNRKLKEVLEIEEIKRINKILFKKVDGVEINNDTTISELCKIREQNNINDEELNKVITNLLTS
ncbi:VirD4-like conjugal transfer protein, CD1115 family [Clostridium baratii]|uniref:VirD4-like conjugal transfer protein, CD1115 family n=1 Tax=Clostridium baratii TaxID=1561 RepID=UPI0030D30AB4